MKIDLHIHSRWSHDGISSIKDVIKRCLESGLDCIAITDHNTITGALHAQQQAPFSVIVGEEIKTTSGDIIGLFLSKEIPKGLSLMDTVLAIKNQGGLVSVPHPVDRLRRSAIGARALNDIISHVDIVEGFNSRTLFQKDNVKGVEIAAAHDISITAVSDAHSISELGRTYVSTRDCPVTPTGLQTALHSGNFVTHTIHPLKRLLPSFNRLRRLLG